MHHRLAIGGAVDFQGLGAKGTLVKLNCLRTVGNDEVRSDRSKSIGNGSAHGRPLVIKRIQLSIHWPPNARKIPNNLNRSERS
jgi:hypothetical protein